MKDEKGNRVKVPARLDETVKKHCDPIYISRLEYNKWVDIDNATLTYIKYNGTLWGITNSHVTEREDNREQLTLPGCGTPRINLSEIDNSKRFRSLETASRNSKLDISIIQLSPEVIDNHFQENSKEAINLDNWESPCAETVRTPVAFGLPTAHKEKSGYVTYHYLLLITGDIGQFGWSEKSSQFSIHALLDEDSEYYLSGISGGPIFEAEGREDNPLVIGIIYEGSPSREENVSDLYGMKNVIVSGYTLTPGIFKEWLETVGFME